MTSDPWFEAAPASAALTQGDVILQCPLLGWKRQAAPPVGASFDLAQLAEPFVEDVVVMTQACDLEQRKVSNVVLCPAIALSTFRSLWEAQRTAVGQSPTPKAWNRELAEIAAGRIWNLSLLDSFTGAEVSSEVRVVFFDQVHTLPRDFLEGLLRNRGVARPRLRPPYREHLSQSFARFFMRVGLPQPIKLPE